MARRLRRNLPLNTTAIVGAITGAALAGSAFSTYMCSNNPKGHGPVVRTLSGTVIGMVAALTGAMAGAALSSGGR